MHVRDRGIVSAFRRAAGIDRSKLDVWQRYAYALRPEVGAAPDVGSLDWRTVNWVVSPFAKSSGGHQNIFRFVHMLEQRGFKTTIVVTEKAWMEGDASLLRSMIREWFLPIDAQVVRDVQDAPPAYFTIATSFPTAYEVRRFRSTVRRCYFVQDLESLFEPAGSTSAFCEATYRFGFHGITAGRWLADKLAADYGMPTSPVGFACDRAIYQPYPRTETGRRVLFYGRPSTYRRAFELGLIALGKVAERHKDVEFVFVGGRLDGYRIPFRHRCEGVLDFPSLARLYSQCDIAVVLSMSNLSLLPLELMACGVPVVSNRAPCTEWLLSDRIAQLVSPTIDGIAEGVSSLLEDEPRRLMLRRAGLEAAQNASWEAEGDRLANILSSLHEGASRG